MTVIAQPGADVRVRTLSSEDEFTELADVWDDLVLAMTRPSPFLLHTWLREWWRHYANDGQLAIHVAYRGDRLVGALPLSVRRRLGLRITEFIGGWALLADVLIARGEDESVVAGALAERASTMDHDFADLYGLTGASRLVAALPPADFRLIERLEAPILELSSGWEAVSQSKLSPKARSMRRRRRRQLEAVGPVEVALARTREELAPALEEAFRVHALRWQGRHDSSEFATPVGKAFHRAALLRLADDDAVRLLTLSVNGKPIAFALSVQLADRAYGLRRAFDPAFGRFSPGSEAKLLSLEAAAAEGMERSEFLGAAAPHNVRFADTFDPICQGIGLARTPRGRVAVAALLAGIRIRRTLKRSATARRLYARARRLKGTRA